MFASKCWPEHKSRLKHPCFALAFTVSLANTVPPRNARRACLK